MPWMSPARTAVVVVTTATLCGACNRVEVKQDTPAAAMASIIKVYAAKRPELLEGADPPRTPIDRVIGRRASRRFPLDESATAAAHG